jgi:hypothetical protein
VGDVPSGSQRRRLARIVRRLACGGRLGALTALALTALLLAAAPALGAPTRDGWGFAVADDDWDWEDPGDLPSLGDGFADLGPKAFRFQMIWNAADFPWHMDRARGLIARARAQGVEQIVVTFKKSVGPDVDPVYGPRPTADGYAEHISEVVRQLGGNVDVWGPANEPNRGEAWLPGVAGAQLLAGYYARLQTAVGTWDPTAEITSPDFVDRTDLGTIAAYVDAYEAAGGGWGDHVAWHPYWGVHAETTQTTLDVIGLAPPGANVWITEVGAFGRSPSGIDDSEEVQNDNVWWLATTLAELPQVERIHYYHMRGNPGSAWDTGLLNVDGSTRLAWHTWCAVAHGDLEHPACQPVTPRSQPPAPPPEPPAPPPAPPTPSPPPTPAFDTIGALVSPAEPPALDGTPPSVTIDRLPGKVSYGAFLRGVRPRVTPSEPSALKVDLLVRTRRASDGRVRRLAVATRVLKASGRARRVRLQPRRRRLGSPRRLTAYVRVRATDLAGNHRTAVERLRVTRR